MPGARGEGASYIHIGVATSAGAAGGGKVVIKRLQVVTCRVSKRENESMAKVKRHKLSSDQGCVGQRKAGGHSVAVPLEFRSCLQHECCVNA